MLSPATSKAAPGRVVWTSERLEAFSHLKRKLCDHCLLTIPVPSYSYSLHTDASARGLGAVLNVKRDGYKLPVAFYSRQLRGAEAHYSATELETLAVVSAVEHFNHTCLTLIL